MAVLENEKLEAMALSLAGFIRNQRRKINHKDTFSYEEVNKIFSYIENISAGILRAADQIEREKRIAEAAEQRKKQEAAEAKEREREKQQIIAAGMNLKCRYHCQRIDNGKVEHSCDIDYPIDHCSINCPYATNVRAGRAKVYQVRIGKKVL